MMIAYKDINYLLIVFLLVIPSLTIGYTHTPPPIEIKLTFDEYQSSYMGSSVIKSTFDVYRYTFPYNNNRKGFIPGSLRLLRFGVDFYLTSFLSMVKHEYSGHGARAREFDRYIDKYEFNFDGSGVTYYNQPYGNSLVKEFTQGKFFVREITIDLAGIESSDVMASIIANGCFASGSMPVGLAAQYFANALDQINYIAITMNSSQNSEGNDIASYKRNINGLYASNKVGALKNAFRSGTLFDQKWDFSINNPTVLKDRDLKQGMYISLLDPFLWYSVYSQFRYVFTGQSQWKFPLINIKGIRYLPRIRTVLAPYGLSTQLQNYFLYNKKSFVVTIQGGKTANQSYYTLGLESGLANIYHKFSIGVKIFAWSQPELYTLNMRDAAKRVGALAALKGRYMCSRDFSLHTTLGYKTRGYVQGEILDSSIVLRAGFSYILR